MYFKAFRNGYSVYDRVKIFIATEHSEHVRTHNMLSSFQIENTCI